MIRKSNEQLCHEADDFVSEHGAKEAAAILRRERPERADDEPKEDKQ